MKYFCIMHGMRGCYMPDGDPHIVAVKTRRELKAIIADECAMIDTGDTIGFGKRNVASFAAACWSEAHSKSPAALPFCLPYKEPGAQHFNFGVFVSVATKSEFEAQEENMDR